MRVLVTGATGLIGGRLVKRLAANHEVVAITRQEIGEPGANPEWIQLDLADALSPGLLPKSIDAVIHLAQSERYNDLPDGAGDVFAINVASTFQLLEYARLAGASRFVLASTGGLYGYGSSPLRETDSLEPLNFYFRSKHLAEQLLAGYEDFFQTVTMRPFFVYGPGRSEMLVARLAEKVRAGDPITIEGNPGLRLNPIYVEDAARAFEGGLSLDQGGVFNVAGPETVTISELVSLIGTAAGLEPKPTWTDNDPPGDLIGSIERMESVLGVTPEVGLEPGLRSLLGVEAKA